MFVVVMSAVIALVLAIIGAAMVLVGVVIGGGHGVIYRNCQSFGRYEHHGLSWCGH